MNKKCDKILGAMQPSSLFFFFSFFFWYIQQEYLRFKFSPNEQIVKFTWVTRPMDL